MSDADAEPGEAFSLDDLLADAEERRRWTAIHEGGHIAVAWALGAYPVSADILAKPDRFGLAVFRLGNDGRASTINHIVVCYAGPAAAKRHAPRRQDGGAGDRDDIERHLLALCRTEDAAVIVRDHCRREAERLVAENWDAVEAVADALVQREALTDQELADVLAQILEARERAESLRRRRDWADLVARTSTT